MRDPPPRVRQITVHPLTMLPRTSLWSERCCPWTTFVMVDACLGTWSERPVPFVLVRSLFSAQLASDFGWAGIYRFRTRLALLIVNDEGNNYPIDRAHRVTTDRHW